MGRTVWDTEAEAKHYKVLWGSKCWPFINSGRAGAKLMGLCPSHEKAGHRKATDAAHVLKGFDRSFAFANFTRAATPEEVALLPPPPAGLSPAGASPASKRLRGGQHFRQPSQA